MAVRLSTSQIPSIVNSSIRNKGTRCSIGGRFRKFPHIVSVRNSSYKSFCRGNLKYSVGSAFVASGVSQSQSVELTHEEIYAILNHEADELLKHLHGSNIFLIGMMGCGKSTVGRILSDVLGYGFFDSDTMIEKAVGTTVSKIFEEQGEAAFRELESQAILQLSSMEGLIIATGGGAIIRDENWRNMKTGVSVWIDVPLEDLAKRVSSAGISSRPILSQGPSSSMDAYSQALERLKGVFEKRKHLYPKADVKVSLRAVAINLGFQSVSDLSPEMIALQILESIREYLKKVVEVEFSEESVPEFTPIEVPFGLEDSPVVVQEQITAS